MTNTCDACLVRVQSIDRSIALQSFQIDLHSDSDRLQKESVKPPPEEEFEDRERRWSTGSQEKSGLMQRLQDIVNEPPPPPEEKPPEPERTRTIPSASNKPPLPRLRYSSNNKATVLHIFVRVHY